VTIYGESAGAFSTFLHLTSPASKGLYRAAITQSGAVGSAWMLTDKHPAFYAKYFAFCILIYIHIVHLEILQMTWAAALKTTLI